MNRLTQFFQRRRLYDDLDEEIAFHLEQRMAELVANGVPANEAAAAARREFGNVGMVKETAREVWGWGWLEDLFGDLRFGARMLRKNPGFTAVAVLTLAFGIGANSTIFSVANALLYRPLPYEHADRLVVIWEMPADHPDSWRPPPIAELLDWKSQNHVFEDIALTSSTEAAVMSGIGGPQPIQVQNVTPNLFSLLGAKPVIGRIFRAEEMQDMAQTVVISTPFWKTHFSSDPDVLGKTFNIGGVVSTVVGVMPPRFAPFYGEAIDAWQPINAASARYSLRQDHWLMPVARLKPGVTLDQAQIEMNVIAARLELAYPATNKGVGKKLVPLHEALFGWARQPVYPLLGAVAFVLLIACANVANLLQSRTESRRNEYAVRASLGAGRRRLMQQLFAESSFLALGGGLLGVLLTYIGIKLFLKVVGDFPSADSIEIDGRVLLFTLGVSLSTTFVFGLVPAMQASNPNLNNALRESARRTSAGSRGLTRHALVVSEVGLAMVLLLGAGLMINSILRLQKVDPGFDSTNLLTMRIQLPEGGKYVQRVPGGDMERATPQVTAFYHQLLEKTAALPGVESVGSITGLPTHFAEGYTFSILGHPIPPPDQRPQAGYDQVSPSLFRTLKIPLKKGRFLDDHDTEASPWVVVVNSTFAHRYFPNEDPIGQQIVLRYDPFPVEEERPRQIVGVVGDVKHSGLGQPAPAFIYASYLQQPAVYPGGAIVAHLWQELAIRTASGTRPEALGATVKNIVAQLDPDQPVTNVMTMDRLLAESIGDYQFYMQLLGTFAGMAVLLAMIGVYGVMSYSVSARAHEIGIRMALGARPADVFNLVVGMGFKLAALGVGIGLALAFALVRFIGTFLFGVKPTDPLTFAAVATTLIAIVLLASYVPARRATRVDPIVALRYE